MQLHFIEFNEMKSKLTKYVEILNLFDSIEVAILLNRKLGWCYFASLRRGYMCNSCNSCSALQELQAIQK